MKQIKCHWGWRVCIILIIIFSTFLQPIQVVAEHREYDAETYEEKIIVPANSIRSIDFEFKGGKELEFVYVLQVKQILPIDIWFVDDENYNYFVAGEEFVYFIDGSAQQVATAKNIIGIKEYDIYQLILANYNNQTVEVDIVYEVRIYKELSIDSSSENYFMANLLHPLSITLITLIIVFILIFVKTRKIKQELDSKNSEKGATRKSKRPKTKKVKENYKDSSKEVPATKNTSRKVKQKPMAPANKSKSKRTTDLSSFCGYCGNPMDTPFCRNCGHEI